MVRLMATLMTMPGSAPSVEHQPYHPRRRYPVLAGQQKTWFVFDQYVNHPSRWAAGDSSEEWLMI